MLILGIEGFYGDHHDNFYPSIWSQLQIDHKNELEEKYLMKLVWYCKFYDIKLDLIAQYRSSWLSN